MCVVRAIVRTVYEWRCRSCDCRLRRSLPIRNKDVMCCGSAANATASVSSRGCEHSQRASCENMLEMEANDHKDTEDLEKLGMM